MPRTATGDIGTFMLTRTGTMPLIAVAIDFGLGITWFSTKSGLLPNGATPYAKILELSACTCTKRDDSSGSAASMDITLDDSDGLIKSVPLDNDVIEQSPATVYLYYPTSTGFLVLLDGKIAGPVKWSEGNRTATFSIESNVEDNDAGFSATDEFDDLAPEAKDRPWPMLFGKVAHFPAVKIREHTNSVLTYGITVESSVYQMPTDPADPIELRTTETVRNDFDGTGGFYVKDGNKFPQDVEIQLSVEGVIFKGTMSGEYFTVTDPNYPKYLDLAFDARPAGDVDEDNAQVAWIEDPKKNIQGCYVYITTESMKTMNFCTKQNGPKCYFKEAWKDGNTFKEMKIGEEDVASEVYKIGEFGGQDTVLNRIYEMHLRFVNQTVFNNTGSFAGGTIKRFLDKCKRHHDFMWTASAGAKVRLWNVADPDIYAVSIVPCTAIHAVYGRRKISVPNARDESYFAPFPSHYYEKQLTSEYEVNGDFVTGIKFWLTPEELKEEGWDDGVWVTATSSVGPAAGDILEYLLTRFTGITVNGASVSNLNDWTEDTPCNFVMYDKRNCLDLVRDIAWQSRAAVLFDQGQARLVYVPELTAPQLTMTESNTDFGSITLGFTQLEQIKTKVVGHWANSLKGRKGSMLIERPEVRGGKFYADIIDPKDNDERFYVYRENINRFGERTVDKRIYIYNEEAHVAKTLNFWGHRLANSWRYIELTGYMPCLILQPWDRINLNFTTPILNNISSAPAIVEETVYDPNTDKVKLRLWIPSLSGSWTVDSGAFE